MKKGFTFIELLLVVTIIGLILSLSIGSYKNIQGSARDAKRKGDLEQLRSALEQYRSVNGSYPTTNSEIHGLCTNPDYTLGNTLTDTGASGYIPNLAPDYVQKLPHDPRENRGARTCGGVSGRPCYLYRSDGLQYKIINFCGVESQVSTLCVLAPTTTDPYFDPMRHDANNCSYQVSSSENARTTW